MCFIIYPYNQLSTLRIGKSYNGFHILFAFIWQSALYSTFFDSPENNVFFTILSHLLFQSDIINCVIYSTYP